VRRVGILGSTSLVGQSLLDDPDPKYQYIPFSRASSEHKTSDKISDWISLVPIWALPDWYSLIEASGGERIVVLSSTSIFTKTTSSDADERRMVEKFIEAESNLAQWAGERSIRCTILRPTMIYGRGLDRNVSQIARLIRRFGFFPLFGSASGLRQPIHVDDVASACRRALETARSPAYNLSGGEPIAYKEMVRRIFKALGKEPRFFTTPLWLFRAAAPAVRLLPKFHDWSPSMAERMNQDLTFDNAEAQSELGITFRRFEPTMKDLIPGL
jgi:nucleoside-diphosphate-sugar epimerase